MKRINRFFRNLSLRYQLGLIPLLFIILSIVNFFIILNFKKQHIESNEVVNLAGRQRMLSQRIAFLAERVAKQDSEVIEDFKKTIALCDQSLGILEKGGIAPKMQGIEISAAPESVLPELTKAKNLWSQYQISALAVLDDPQNLAFLEDNAVIMLELFNNLVIAFVNSNESQQRVLDVVL